MLEMLEPGDIYQGQLLSEWKNTERGGRGRQRERGRGINRQTNGQIETKRDTERGLAGRKALSVETSKLFGIIHGFTRSEIFLAGFWSLFGPFLTHYILLSQSLNGNVSAMPLYFGSMQFAF